MSRWTEAFENHPFQTNWNEILEVVEEVIVDDKTIITSVEEIARLNKVVLFLDSLLKSCDPELIPESTWTNFNSQSNSCLLQINSYQNNRNISHITNANKHLDNLLTYIRPYQVVAGKAAQSASASFVAYTKVINTNLSSFQAEANKLLVEVGKFKNQVENDAKESEAAKIRIKELETNYFDDTEEESLETRINSFEVKLEENFDKIQKYRTELLDGDSDNESISSEVKNAVELAEKDSNNIKELLNEVKGKLTDFKEYHTDVFGIKNEEGELEGGLKAEIVAREKHLEEFKKQQELKYKTLNDEIESLLPGATSAGLATAYHELKESFNSPIKTYTRLFYSSIMALVLVAFLSITNEVGWFFIKFVEVTDISILASNILYKLPIVLPVLWLTLFASKRRSETQRLQQEYAHKEALAKSYQNFKMQIEALGQTDPALMNKLLSSAIDAVSKNASDTLDKKHGDTSPMHEGVEGFLSSLERAKKAVT